MSFVPQPVVVPDRYSVSIVSPYGFKMVDDASRRSFDDEWRISGRLRATRHVALRLVPEF